MQKVIFGKVFWGDAPRITGIECVREVEYDPSGKFTKGQSVLSIVGGLGREHNGSYAEYTVAKFSNVVSVNKKSLSWTEFAALPEVYATAWWCLTNNINLLPGQAVLIRGGHLPLGRLQLT